MSGARILAARTRHIALLRADRLNLSPDARAFRFAANMHVQILGKTPGSKRYHHTAHVLRRFESGQRY